MIIGKLKLKKDAVVWDIGAGTGSVSVECARQCPYGEVHAVERFEDAAALIGKNKEKFDLKHLYIHQGRASEVIKDLPEPTHIFIGGSGRELSQVLTHIRSLGSGIRVMVSCVTVETLAEAAGCFKEGFDSCDMIQANISRSRALGDYHILESNNPVTLLWGITK